MEYRKYTIYTYASLDINWDLLQLEIVGIPVALGLALANYLNTQSLYLMTFAKIQFSESCIK